MQNPSAAEAELRQQLCQKGAMAKIALLSFLDEHNLASTEPALRDLGAESVDDLRDLDDSDIERLGLKKLELKRFTRAVQELRAQADEAAVRGG